jgi:FtsZ-interacting cell division protein ZipA
MTTKLLKDANLKKKEEAKLAKLKEKEDAKNAKLKEKEDKKLAKLKDKEEKKNKNKNTNTVIIINLVDEENEIIQNEIISEEIDLGGCIEILKFGSNKGNKCCKSIYNNNLCKRHFDKLSK